LTHDKYTRGLLAALLGLSLAACQGEAGPAGAAGQDGQDGEPGEQGPVGNQGPGAQLPPGVGLKLDIQATTIATDGTVVVTFKATDAAGVAVDAVAERAAKATTGFDPRFTLARITADGASESIYLSTTGSPSSDRDGAIAATGTPGVYTYTFVKKVPVTDAALTHTVGVWAYRYDANQVRFASSDTLNFVPGGGTPVTREIVADAACNQCHTNLTLHGSRQTVALCVTCHTPQLAGGEANMAYMAHKIHMGHNLVNGYELGGHEYSEVTYPQSIKNCTSCHQGANAANYKTPAKVSVAACGSCHDDVNFVTGAGHSAANIAIGTMVCSYCHNDPAVIERDHAPVVAPDPTSTLHGGTNSRTNAGWLAAANYVPAGADVLSYDVKSVSRDANKNPVLVAKLKKNGTTDVAFVPFTTGSKSMIENFVGTPVAYFAFAVPQDGVAKPADFNATASVALREIWNGAVTTSTLEGPDSEGYYTVTIKNVIVPDSATMLTGGMGYAYDLPKNQPLTQTNLAAYPYDATTGTGGLIVPIPNKSVVGKKQDLADPAKFTNYSARRAIVSNDKCNACHEFLGAAPSYHVGQRNDAPTCSFCHNPNRTSSAWSANAKDFVHGVHAAGFRTEPFTWHQLSDTEGFWQVTYPAAVDNCEACHLPGTYDFRASASAAALPNLLSSTVATSQSITTTHLDATYAGLDHSPYVNETTDYGKGFSFAGATGATTEAAGTTLVTTPVTAACVACHDSNISIAHMESNGGAFYGVRSASPAAAEQCMICHAPGDVADIKAVHAR
jgi:OmcA/MtrC family decaheme c-type cytochrome